ncbi:MAG: hypothetical protein JXA67_19845 [Micromonosporaceae bacterium]|nr:hypothetical protein [Micromonosporaceae bacterium]
MIIAYGLANLLQSVAAARIDLHRGFHPRLLLRLGRHKAYLAGVFCQFLGFMLAVFARGDLPLFLVQSAIAAGLGVTAVLGVFVLGWRLPRAEIVLLVVLCVGIAILVLSARPGGAKPIGPGGVFALGAALVVIPAAGFMAARLHGARGSVVLGSLAGLSFGAAAVAARPLAGSFSAERFLTDPLLYLLIAHSVVGQLLLAMAMQRGSITASVASMDASAAVPAAIIGVWLLGDGIVPGREWLAVVGFLGTLCAVIGLVYYAEPQCHPQPGSDYGQMVTPVEAIGSELVKAWSDGAGGAG